jgi:hypothetical protein
VWTCKAETEEAVWNTLEGVKKLSTKELKKLFKIEIMLIEQVTTTDSSMIKRAVYNFASNTLKIEFNSGAIYEYANLEPGMYDDFCKAESQGKFFNEKIKNNYPNSKLINS